ncbi:MAG: hypothetical protein DRP75_02705 [Candidatus Omnitrophota bacterium]|nr:MAG: hypothetical protein DRP75_02705 [Candidatus Omnitrophota bacterium]
MLRLMRKKTRTIMIFSALLIIPAFFLWGINARIEAKRYAGRIGKRRISYREYYQNLKAVKYQALLGYGDSKAEQDLPLEQQVWQRLYLIEEARRKKIKVSDEQVIAYIKKIPLFQDKEGFNKQRYKQILQSLGIEPRTFEELVRDTLKIRKLHPLKKSN